LHRFWALLFCLRSSIFFVAAASANFKEGKVMKKSLLSACAALSLVALAGCDTPVENANESEADAIDAQADAVRAEGEATADAMEDQADAMDTKADGVDSATENKMEADAQTVRETADAKADAMEDKADAKK
jgi:uncharacterized membrane protein YqiK